MRTRSCDAAHVPLDRLGLRVLTLSLFSGEVWSYSGWGVPMVWEDPTTLTAIGTWLFYVGAIHLHLGGLWSRRMRARR